MLLTDKELLKNTGQAWTRAEMFFTRTSRSGVEGKSYYQLQLKNHQSSPIRHQMTVRPPTPIHHILNDKPAKLENPINKCKKEKWKGIVKIKMYDHPPSLGPQIRAAFIDVLLLLQLPGRGPLEYIEQIWKSIHLLLRGPKLKWVVYRISLMLHHPSCLFSLW